MTTVKFEAYSFRTEEREGLKLIFDEVRKKMVALTPEEWVRQHVIHYLIYTLHYPKSLIAVERGFTVNGLRKRFDLVVFSKGGRPLLMIECKSPTEQLNEKVFRQMATYNLQLKAGYFWLSNGIDNYCCRLSDGFLMNEVPEFKDLEA